MSRAYRPLLRHARRRRLPSRAGFTRREVLRLGLAAAAVAAAAPLTGCASRGRQARGSPLDMPSAKGLNVIVVGGGFAGLTAAVTLADAGADVTVLEAGPRTGGRVSTDRTIRPGHNVELGGEWVGTNHPTWQMMARRYGIELIEGPEYDGDEPVLLDGRRVAAEEADRAFEEIDAAIADLIKLARGIDPIRPWTDPRAAELDKQSLAAWVRARGMGATAERLMLVIEEADNGVPAEDMSLLAYLAMVAGGGYEDYYEISETHRTKHGNDTLADALTRRLGDRAIVKAPVTKADRTESGVTVTTRDGRTFSGNALVLAIPPTVWGDIAFTPALDGGLAPQMGRNTKMILSLKRPVWKEAGAKPELLSDGLVQLTWESMKEAQDGPTVMTLFSGGTSTDELRAIEPARRAAAAIASVSPAYPGLADAVEGDRFVDWPGIPTARASYCFPAPGHVTALGPTLVDGLNDGLSPLMFAGEHTSFAFAGYMEGALSSGVRVARALAQSAAPDAPRSRLA